MAVELPEDLRSGIATEHRVRVGEAEPVGQQPEAQAADHRHHLGLLVDEPADHLGEPERVLGQEPGAAGQVDEDRIGLRDAPAVASSSTGVVRIGLIWA